MPGQPRIRVLQIGKFYHPVHGGMEEHLFNLCNDLKGVVDLRVIVSNTRACTVVETVANVEVVRVARLCEFMSTPLCPALIGWLRRAPADIIHVHLPNPMAHLALLAARPRARIVATWHSDVVKRGILPRLYERSLRDLLRDCDAVIATSARYIEFSELLSEARDRCVVIPLGVSPERYVLRQEDQGPVADLRARYGPRLVLFVGRLAPYKGVGYLLEAMERVHGKLVVVGGGAEERALRRKAERLGLGTKVELIGAVPRDAIISYFHACDVFVLPSIEPSEAFGVVQLEAMACGKPVVSTDLPSGVPWVNQHGNTGLIVPPRDAESLAKAINRLLDDSDLATKLGASGQRRVQDEFNSARVAERTLRVYTDVCRRPLVGTAEHSRRLTKAGR